MERLTKRDTDGQAMMDCEKCKADWTGRHGKPMFDCTALYCRNRLKDRLAAYEDTGLTPERCAEFARADAEGRYIVMRDAEQEGVARLRELAEADKEGRLFLLPTEPGRPMLCQEHFERPWVMKNVTLCVQYQSSAGIIFYMGYDVFHGLVERGRITPSRKREKKRWRGKRMFDINEVPYAEWLEKSLQAIVPLKPVSLCFAARSTPDITTRMQRTRL